MAKRGPVRKGKKSYDFFRFLTGPQFFPGYAKSFTEIGKGRGWPPVTCAQFEALRGPTGALLVDDSERAAAKILRVHEALDGISRLTSQMSVAALPHTKRMHAIELLGTRVAPLVRTALGSGASMVGQEPGVPGMLTIT